MWYGTRYTVYQTSVVAYNFRWYSIHRYQDHTLLISDTDNSRHIQSTNMIYTLQIWSIRALYKYVKVTVVITS